MNQLLFWLAATVLATALMWVPYILNSFLVRGVLTTVGYDEDIEPLSAWARRAKKAHLNAVENLVLFVPLVFAHGLLQNETTTVVTAAAVYFFARVGHWVAYTAKVPYARTMTFVVGWGALMVLAVALVGRLV